MWSIEAYLEDTSIIEEDLSFKKAIQRAKGWLDRDADIVEITNEETGDISALVKLNGQYKTFHREHGINRGFASPFKLNTEEKEAVFAARRDPEARNTVAFQSAARKVTGHTVSVENQARRIAQGLSGLGFPTEAEVSSLTIEE